MIPIKSLFPPFLYFCCFGAFCSSGGQQDTVTELCVRERERETERGTLVCSFFTASWDGIIRVIVNHHDNRLCRGLHKARPAFAAGNRHTGNQRGENCRTRGDSFVRVVSTSRPGLHFYKPSSISMFL